MCQAVGSGVIYSNCGARFTQRKLKLRETDGPKISHPCVFGTQDSKDIVSAPHQPDLPQSFLAHLRLCSPKLGPSLFQPATLVTSPKGLV